MDAMIEEYLEGLAVRLPSPHSLGGYFDNMDGLKQSICLGIYDDPGIVFHLSSSYY